MGTRAGTTARTAAVALTVVLVTQCASRPPIPPPLAAPAPTPAPAPAIPRPAPAPPQVSTVTAAELGPTWRPGCPVSPDELRAVNLEYRGFDGITHRGRLVVHRDVTAQVIDVFAALYRMHYPIERMQTPDHYAGASDELSMRDDNTSAYNCRDIPGTGRWSLHALGRAVDVNPKLNPSVNSDGSDLQPANGGPWLDRTRTGPGVLHGDDPAVRAFLDRGWQWGGNWRNPLDYQHFELR